MAICWVGAVLQSLCLGYFWWTGEIRFKGWKPIIRADEPGRFRFLMVGGLVSIAILAAAAIFPEMNRPL